MDQANSSLFAVKDMAGNEIVPGSVLVYPLNKEIKFAIVDEISVSVSRSNPKQPKVKIHLTGCHGDPRFIRTSPVVTDGAKYLVTHYTKESNNQNDNSSTSKTNVTVGNNPGYKSPLDALIGNSIT